MFGFFEGKGRRMDFKQALAQMNEWIERSNGLPILMNDGEHRKFIRLQRYSLEKISEFEKKREVKLPDDYVELLLEVGAFEAFITEYGLGRLFYKLEDIEEFNGKIFYEEDNLFPKFFICISLLGRGDFGGFNLLIDEPNFDTFSHEEPTEEWIESREKWFYFREWFCRLVETEGKKDLTYGL